MFVAYLLFRPEQDPASIWNVSIIGAFSTLEKAQEACCGYLFDDFAGRVLCIEDMEDPEEAEWAANYLAVWKGVKEGPLTWSGKYKAFSDEKDKQYDANLGPALQIKEVPSLDLRVDDYATGDGKCFAEVSMEAARKLAESAG